MNTGNTAHEQSLEELIEELAAKLPVATKLRGFVEETDGIWPLETLKRIPYPEGIRFRSGKNYIYRTRALLRYLLSRGSKYSGQLIRPNKLQTIEVDGEHCSLAQRSMVAD